LSAPAAITVRDLELPEPILGAQDRCVHRRIIPLVIIGVSAGAWFPLGCSGGGALLDGGASGDGPSDGGTIVAMDGGGEPADGGAPNDAGGAIGTLIISSEGGVATPVHLTPDLSALFFVQNDKLEAISLTGGGLARDLGSAPSSIAESSAFHTLWLGYDAPPSPQPLQSTLRALDDTTTSTPAQLASRAVILALNPDWTRALILEDLQGGVTSSATADLAAVGLGAPKVELTSVTVGRWDPMRRTYTGRCAPNGAFTSSITAFVAVCPGPPLAPADTRVLMRVDLSTRTSSVIARGVLPTIVVGADRLFVLFLDGARHLIGVDRAGRRTRMIADASPVTGVTALSGRRFAYTTQGRALKVAAWPAMAPVEILPSGADRIERRSGNGSFVMFRKDPAVNGLRDLYAVATGTRTASFPIALDMNVDGVPGDSAFTADSRTALWFNGTTFDGTTPIGDAMSIKTDAAGPPVLLARGASTIETYGSATNVLIFANTRHETDIHGDDRLAADLAVRRADGTADLQVLVPGVDASAFKTRRSTIAYRLPPGMLSGIWLTTLPTD
jgi:hypothetical protein